MRYLVRVRPDKIDEVKASLSRMGIEPISITFDYITLDVPPEVASRVAELPYVVEVRPEKKVQITRLPIDKKLAEFMTYLRHPLKLPLAPLWSIQADADREIFPTSESRKMIGANVAEEEGWTGKGIKVALLDTGWDPLNIQKMIFDGKSTVEGQPLFFDENGHGTHCGSTITGRAIPTPWGSIKGVAPDVELGVFKCLGYGLGAGSQTSVMRAMMDAFEWGADIISGSLGSPYSEEPTDTIPECRAVRMLTNAGIINCWANGNDGPEPNTVGVPANEPSALSVGAVDRAGKVADFSSRGPTAEGIIKCDVVAPGVDILSSTVGLIDMLQAHDGPKLAAISGTSMSTPHVSGLVAIALQYARSKGVNLTTDHIKEAMDLYGDYPGGAKNNDYGWGLITWDILKRYIDEKLVARPRAIPAVPAVPPARGE